jgi:hypothetical protein
MVEPLKVITQTESWQQEVKEDVVAMIKRLLQCAEAGEIQGLAYAAVTIDGCTLDAFSKSANHAILIAGLERVKFRLLSQE